MEAVAIITARGQSKRLPNKNVAELGNKPLLRWAIEAAKNSNAVTETYITTDNEEYAKIARSAGAKIINRPPELATDTATSEDTVAHALTAISHARIAARRRDPEIGVLIQPTSPLTRPNTIAKAVEAVRDKGYDTAISVHESHHKPWWSFLRDADGQLREFMPIPKGYNSEVSPTIYFPTGGCYAFRTKFFLDQGRLYGGRMYGVATTWAEAIDIDDDKDLEFARWALHIIDGSLREVEENAV